MLFSGLLSNGCFYRKIEDFCMFSSDVAWVNFSAELSEFAVLLFWPPWPYPPRRCMPDTKLHVVGLSLWPLLYRQQLLETPLGSCSSKGYFVFFKQHILFIKTLVKSSGWLLLPKPGVYIQNCMCTVDQFIPLIPVFPLQMHFILSWMHVMYFTQNTFSMSPCLLPRFSSFNDTWIVQVISTV